MANILKKLQAHVTALHACNRCPAMHKPVVSGPPVVSKALLVGQAPGDKEPMLGRPFAWTAGKTLFRWFEEHCDIAEEEFRSHIYMAAVCRCFPGKNPKGGDRVPDANEIANCATWLDAEIALLQPQLIMPVGKLAIRQFLKFDKLTEVIGQSFKTADGHCDIVPLPHPSGASTWHRMEPGKSLLNDAMQLICQHPVMSNGR